MGSANCCGLKPLFLALHRRGSLDFEKKKKRQPGAIIWKNKGLS